MSTTTQRDLQIHIPRNICSECGGRYGHTSPFCRKLDLQESLADEEVCNDITEVVSQRAFFDSNGCDSHFHLFRRVNNRLEAFHADDQPCGVSEYFLPLEDI